MKTPQWVKDLSDDLLLHSYWDTAPPAVLTLKARALAKVRALQDDPPWLTWTEIEWIYALTFVSIGVGIVAEMARVYKLLAQSAGGVQE